VGSHSRLCGVTTTIRRAHLADLDTLVELRLRFRADVECSDYDPTTDPRTDDTRRFYERTIETGEHVVWLAECEGATVGCTAVTLIPVPPRNHAGVDHDGLVLTVWVDPDHRGRGIARRLMDELLAARAELRIHRLMLKATDVAKPLYESLGFTSPPDLLELA
jgi:ribosomal protein S18 acetylase RimI-like enzyme